MILWKSDRYREAFALPNTSTQQIELPRLGLCSYIKLDFRCKVEDLTATATYHRIVDHISNIKVTDGGTLTIMSLSGQQLKALSWYLNQIILPERQDIYDGTSQTCTIIIPFGRYLRDLGYLLDFSKYDRLYLEITNTATVTWIEADSLNVDVQLVTVQGLSTSPAKYLKYYQWRSERPAAAGQWLYHQIPTQWPVFAIMAQLDPDLDATNKTTGDPVSDSYKVQLKLREGANTLWDHRPKDIMRDNAAFYGCPEVDGIDYPSETNAIDMLLAYSQALTLAHISDDGVQATLFSILNTADRFKDWAKVTGYNGMRVSYHNRGIGYYHTMMLLHFPNIAETDWLDPSIGAGQGPVVISIFGYNNKFLLRTVIGSPFKQGEA